MGAKDSKPSFISYEDAVKRVSDSELRRIREAFKRCTGTNGTALSLEAFVHEVLCDGVPYEVAVWLFQACGGTKRGIAFRDLLCGIVVLTKGNIEEKIKFLWTLYVNNQNDNGTYIYKSDFSCLLNFENASLPVETVTTAEVLTGLFGLGEKVTFEQFRSWLLIHKDATVLSKWLLTDRANVSHDLETPTFYQSLAGVTHLEERDIIELEKCFWSLRNAAPTGQLDAESLTPLLSPPLPRAAVEGTFLAFDENRDGHVDFKELCCGLSAACRGPRTERLKFCFKIFDLDRDGVLNKKELIDMVGILCTVANESLKNSSRASTPSDSTGSEAAEKGFDPEATLLHLRDKLVRHERRAHFQLGPDSDAMRSNQIAQEEPEEGPIASGMALTPEDFLIWSVESAEALVSPFLDVVFEVCHVVLGLRPLCKHMERDIVLGWLRRAVSSGYSVGQFWYLVGGEWWASWGSYCSGSGPCCRAQPRALDEAIVCDESFTTNSTESMGSLLWRLETASVGSASSSGVSSAHGRPPPHPGPIDNKRLLAHSLLKVRTLTGEGGHLRRDVTLAQHRDFELLPDQLWRAMAHWYGAPDPLPRQVIRPPNADVELELYPLHLKLLRHVASPQRLSGVGMGVGVGGGPGASLYSSVPLAPAPPERQLAYTAAFSRLATVKQVSEFLCQALGLAREDMRLWSVGANNVLLDDERPTLQELRLDERTRLLIEVRNADLTWPEEIGALSLSGGGCRATERRETLTAPDVAGATGLHNLGNTCYMNAALQAVWNTGPLTRYFNSGMHLYEVNPNNPLGTRGALALRYGELCKEVWGCSVRSVAPLRVRWCVSRWARGLAGGGQHDAQELLAWLLDALHEDLNRAEPPNRTPHHHHHRDSDGRPDQTVASEAWEAYAARNHSIVTELFHGQLKSKVRCDACGRDSVRFDAFNMLSLPLPMECTTRAEVRVMLLDGSVPVKYGVKVNSEGTYLDLKKKLSELCGLPPESMLIVELNGAMFGRVFEDGAKIASGGATDLYAYETPPEGDEVGQEGDEGGQEGDEDPATQQDGLVDGAAWPEVSVPRRSTSSLCMPALFCFKRSRSEILMSQSPPATAYGQRLQRDCRSSTLPRDLSDLKRSAPNGGSSPTLSVKSLTVSSPRASAPPASPRPPKGRHQRPPTPPSALPKLNYLVAVHRKQCRSDVYFVGPGRSRAALFGVPLVVPLREGQSGRDLYAAVWTQLSRLLTKRPTHHDHNHATDCDDSLGYEFPFTLRVVGPSGAWCGLCAWPLLCRGCPLPADHRPLVTTTEDSPLNVHGNQREDNERLADHEEGESQEGVPRALRRLSLGFLRRQARRQRALLAIDWDPTALHLRYQNTREKAWVDHSSVASVALEASRPVDLASCLRAFTGEERLEERYHCARCRSKQTATKKLQIWRAPPILIIHLKRFQYVNNKWIKSQKVVNFPFENFDPTAYLASVPQETILRHLELKATRRRSSMFVDELSSDPEDIPEDSELDSEASKPKARRRRGSEARTRQRLESSSLVTTPVTDDNLMDYHQHHLVKDQDPFDLKYRLYAVVSHSGQLSGGHYVAYALNPSGRWLCLNDSSCRELPPCPNGRPPIDPASAYLLFYERQGLDYERYLPDITGKELVIKDSEALDPDEKKMCVIA